MKGWCRRWLSIPVRGENSPPACHREPIDRSDDRSGHRFIVAPRHLCRNHQRVAVHCPGCANLLDGLAHESRTRRYLQVPCLCGDRARRGVDCRGAGPHLTVVLRNRHGIRRTHRSDLSGNL